jgi:hypothetical protein
VITSSSTGCGPCVQQSGPIFCDCGRRCVKTEDVEEPPPDLDMKFAALTSKHRSNPPVFKQGAMPERDEATDDTIELLQVQRKF